MTRSSSLLRVKRGSMTHIGTTPCKYRIDVFISYIDNIKNAGDVCITWERRGKVEATPVVKVRDGKAVLRQTLSMESTLFKRNMKEKSRKGQADAEQIKFDEKKVKFVLWRGGRDGKAIGKISMDIAAYVRGVTSTVLADLKLSNGSVVVSKIEATLLHMGRGESEGSNAASETYSEMSPSQSFDVDSLFGEDEDDVTEVETRSTRSSPPKSEAGASSSDLTLSPISTSSSSPARGFQATKESAVPGSQQENLQRKESENQSGAQENRCETSSKRKSIMGALHVSRQRDDQLKPSPSLRQKLKNKIKEKASTKKDCEGDAESSEAMPSTRKGRQTRSTNEAEVKELRRLVESLKEENAKLRRGKQAAMDEIDALRNDLEACENALEEATQGSGLDKHESDNADSKSLNAKDKKIAELSAQNQNLVDELEEIHQDAQTYHDEKHLRDTIKGLRGKIEDLEVALKREPQYLDVVNELKVTKVSLALAHMEREQAIFALQTLKHDLGVED